MFCFHVYLYDPFKPSKRCLVVAGNDTEYFLGSLFGPRGVSTLESLYCLKRFGDERKQQTGSLRHWQRPRKIHV